MSSRAISMDQTELGLRVGVGRNTISAIENGKAVNAETLFKVLEQLDLIDDFQLVIDEKLEGQTQHFSRKTRKVQPLLDNDF